MAHDHHHHHGDPNTYYLEQIFTIGACGALAGVTFMDWYTGRLNHYISNERYHPLVVGGSLLLLALVVIRAVAVWFSVAEPTAVPTHDHDHDHDHADGHEHCCHTHDHAHEHAHTHGHAHHHHEHGAHAHGVTAAGPGLAASPAVVTEPARAAGPAVTPGNGHDHGHLHDHGHGHDHGHDHGWAPWRYVVLLLPVGLYFLLPASGFGLRGKGLDPSQVGAIDSTAEAVAAVSAVLGPMQPDGQPWNTLASVAAAEAMKAKGEDLSVGFLQLEMASQSPESRSFYEGKTVTLVGRCGGADESRLSLTRYRAVCCSADAVPINAMIVVAPQSKERLNPNQLRDKLHKVSGRVQFLKRLDTNAFVTALVLHPTKDKPLSELVQVVPQPANPYLN